MILSVERLCYCDPCVTVRPNLWSKIQYHLAWDVDVDRSHTEKSLSTTRTVN